MSHASDFIIANGILIKFHGTDTHVEIPAGVTAIGEYAFYRCTALESVTIPDSVTTIDEGAFRHCTSLRSVVIPQGVTTIGKYAFMCCYRLTMVCLPDGIVNIGDYAFLDCHDLIHVATPQKKVFDTILKRMDPPQRVRVLAVIVRDGPIDPDLLPKIKANRDKILVVAVEEDDDHIVANLFALYKTIPLEKLDEYVSKAQGAPKVAAFLLAYKNEHYSPDYQARQEEIQMEKDFGLREKTLADWKKEFSLKKEDGRYVICGYRGTDTIVDIPARIAGLPVVVGEKAFTPRADRLSEAVREARRQIQAVTIAEGVTEIGANAFNGCVGLTTVTVPATVTWLHNGTFGFCYALTTVTLPEGLTHIERGAFCGCYSLTAVTFPPTVTEIGEMSFDGCGGLTSVIIPATVTRLEERSFYGCRNLQDVYITSATTRFGEKVFAECPNLTIHAPAGSYAEKYAKENNIPFVAE